jgi:hypothetical protein
MNKGYSLLFLLSILILISSSNVVMAATRTVQLQSGWNMFSLPVNEIISSRDFLKNCAVASFVWHYNVLSGAYDRIDTLNPGVGYWVKLGSSCSITMTNTSINLTDLPELDNGWNQIGSVTNTTDASGLSGACIVSGPWMYNTSTSSYVLATTLQPGYSYWVKTGGSCVSNNLVGYWKLDEGLGNTAYDSSEYSNNGTLYNGSSACSGNSCPQWTPGKYGNALNFNGKGSYVLIAKQSNGDSPIWRMSTQVTMEAWVKIPTIGDTVGNYYGIIGCEGDDYWAQGYDLYYDNSNNRLGMRLGWADGSKGGSGNNTFLFYSVNLQDNKWHHVAGVFNKPNLYLYVDGVQVNTSQSNHVITNRECSCNIGTLGISPTWVQNNYFNGTIDEAKLWNRSLTGAEILSEYGGSQQTCSDGTVYSSCSSTKPKYCSSGTLIDKCSQCGCSSGTCQADGTCISTLNLNQLVPTLTGVNYGPKYLGGTEYGCSNPPCYTPSSTNKPPVNLVFNNISSYGFNFVRVNFNWEAYYLNPTAFLNEIEDTAKAAQSAGIYIIFDFMHYGTSSYFYGDAFHIGFPSYLLTAYSKDATGEESFWKDFYNNTITYNGQKIWDLQAEMFHQIINRADKYSSVLGYELLNEPPIYDNSQYQKLGNFHTYLAQKIRSFGSNKAIVFDRAYPSGNSAYIDMNYYPLIAPTGVNDIIFAPHRYSTWYKGMFNSYKNLATNYWGGIPVIVGEWSEPDEGNMTAYVSELKNTSFGWTYYSWTYGSTDQNLVTSSWKDLTIYGQWLVNAMNNIYSSASLTTSLSGSGTCTVSVGLSASGCNGQAWQVRDGSTVKCSGTVSGSPYSNTCTGWSVSAGTYTYDLYIGGTLKDTKSVTCGSGCTKSNPTVTISPTTQTSSAGQSMSYTVSVKDNDNSGCGSSTFTLSRTCPTGWTCTLSKTSVSVSPGITDTSASLSVTSSSSATGTNTFSVTATSGSYTGAGSASYVISSGYYDFTVSVSGSTYYVKDPSGSNTPYTSAASAIQAALNAVGTGQTIYIKGGTYPITSGLSGGKNDVTIDGDKTAVIKATTQVNRMLLWQGSASAHIHGFTLKNVVFDANLLTTNAVAVKYSDNSLIDGIEVRNTAKVQYAEGIDIIGTGSPVTGMTVRNCYVHNTYYAGIALSDVTDSLIEYNNFMDCSQIMQSGGAISPQIGCDRVTIRYNNITGRTDNDGIYIGSGGNPVSGVIITDNFINISIYPDYWNNDPSMAGSAIHAYTSTGCEFARNTITWNAVVGGVSYPVYTAGIENWGTNANIHDNTVTGFKYCIGSQYYISNSVVYYTTVGNHVITKNHLISCINGIYLLQSGSTVTGNTLTGCTTPIYNAGGNTVSGNTIN